MTVVGMLAEDYLQLAVDLRRAHVHQSRAAADLLEQLEAVLGREDRPAHLPDHDHVVLPFEVLAQQLADKLPAGQVRRGRKQVLSLPL